MRGVVSKSVRRILAASVLALLFGCALPGNARTPSVAINQLPVTIEYRSYPAGSPPPGLLSSTESAAGICDAQFKTVAQCNALYPRLGVNRVTATIHSVEISLMLKIVIWLAVGSSESVVEHEETHRAIAEHFYRMGETVSRQSAGRIVGQKLTISASDNQRVLEATLSGITQTIVDDVQRQLSDRCSYAQQRFDAITDHGRNPISVEDAKAQALAEESANWASRVSSNRRRAAPPAVASAERYR
jgi:hypothetical protein